MKKYFCSALVLVLVGCSDEEHSIDMSYKHLVLSKKVYLESCAVCHGIDGDGAGVAAPALDPKPGAVMDWHSSYSYAEFRNKVLNSNSHPPFDYLNDLEAIYVYSRTISSK